MRTVINYNKVYFTFGLTNKQDYNNFIKKLYIDKQMSSQQIVDMIEKQSGVKMSVRWMQLTIQKLGIARKAVDSFKLACSQGRVKWAYKSDKIKRVAIGVSKRYKILERDNFKCKACGIGADNAVLEVHHIIEIHEGGNNADSNLKTYCHNCHIGHHHSRK